MSSKKTETWPVSILPNTPGGESKNATFVFFFLRLTNSISVPLVFFVSHLMRITLQYSGSKVEMSPNYHLDLSLFLASLSWENIGGHA